MNVVCLFRQNSHRFSLSDSVQNSEPHAVLALPGIIPQNILAFRTITMLLARIQPKRQPYHNKDREDQALRGDPEVRQHVRISDALTHLASADFDIIAVATSKFTSSDRVFLFAKNPRRDDPLTDPIVTYPNIISATQPEDIGSQMLNDYIENLDGRS
jgi:hypothetical protein